MAIDGNDVNKKLDVQQPDEADLQELRILLPDGERRAPYRDVS